ncbi:MAG: mechanosensitive ion channel [Cyanothece sp. SIO2G6]|nr:mechanosensitive ion channel [Cyanothece sp. SIO2G6]
MTSLPLDKVNATNLNTINLNAINLKAIYQDFIQPNQFWLGGTIVVMIVDLLLLWPTIPPNWSVLELCLAFLLATNNIFLISNLFDIFFNKYLLNFALQDTRKTNSELLALGQFLVKTIIVLIVVFFFAQFHHINLIGLIASLGIGGVAIAFASQKMLEQILWSVVLYIDQPFTVDDYIHLPDRTLGRVESVGWRSTKIRLSGKNTLMIVPNSNLAQANIENLTRASRVISMVSLTFSKAMSSEERALIRQLIMGSTNDILGIDHQLTQVSFKDLLDESGQDYVQAQVIFFILGAADSSLELRKGLLEIAQNNIVQRLRSYGVDFSYVESTVDITQPMNI